MNQPSAAHSVVGAAPVAVGVVSWNTRELLARCLESLRPEVDAGRAEVTVVDNASTDGSPDLVRERFSWVRLIASRDNLGFGRAANLAARDASADWIAVANADVALRPGALEALVRAGDGDAGAGAIAPRLVLPDGSTQHSVNVFPTIALSVVYATGAFRAFPKLGDRFALPGHWDPDRPRRVPWALGAFLLIRREAWEAVGGFDERQWMYAEDVDLGWRLQEAGWATRYEPGAWVDHESAASTTQMFGPELEPHWQRSSYGFIARRRGIARTWAIASLNFVGAAARWAILVPLAAVRPERAGRRRFWGRWALVHLRALRSRKTLESIR